MRGFALARRGRLRQAWRFRGGPACFSMTVWREFLAAEVLTHFGETSWENVGCGEISPKKQHVPAETGTHFSTRASIPLPDLMSREIFGNLHPTAARPDEPRSCLQFPSVEKNSNPMT